MSRLATILGFAALCVLALSAITASSAVAGTTAFTCVTGGAAGPNKFSDADCATVDNTAGTFGHEAIAVGASTTLTLTPKVNSLLTATLFGLKFELEAVGFECEGCAAENAVVGGVMEWKGGGVKLRLNAATVVSQAGCTVTGSAKGVITTEKLKFTTTVPGEVTFEPEVGNTVAIFSITGATCAVAGNNLKLTGKLKASLSGAKMTWNIAKAAGELKLEGERAGLKAESTMELGTGATHNPAALTTA